jgi:hypothetical protein
MKRMNSKQLYCIRKYYANKNAEKKAKRVNLTQQIADLQKQMQQLSKALEAVS